MWQGCLGMAEFLKFWEERLENGFSDLKEKLDQEKDRKALYQNRYYAEVAKNAHLEERVSELQALLTERALRDATQSNKVA